MKTTGWIAFSAPSIALLPLRPHLHYTLRVDETGLRYTQQIGLDRIDAKVQRQTVPFAMPGK